MTICKRIVLSARTLPFALLLALAPACLDAELIADDQPEEEQLDEFVDGEPTEGDDQGPTDTTGAADQKRRPGTDDGPTDDTGATADDTADDSESPGVIGSPPPPPANPPFEPTGGIGTSP